MLSSLHYEYNTFVDAAFVKTNKQTNTYMQQTAHLGSAHVSSLTGTFFIIDDLSTPVTCTRLCRISSSISSPCSGWISGFTSKIFRKYL